MDNETDFDPRPRCARCGEVAPLDTAVIHARGLLCSDCDYAVLVVRASFEITDGRVVSL